MSATGKGKSTENIHSKASSSPNTQGASRPLTYREKHAQANREALATVCALGITIVVWIVCGFGLASLDATVFHTPLWVIGGTLGTWICAIVVSMVLAKRLFVGFDLDDEGTPHE